MRYYVLLLLGLITLASSAQTVEKSNTILNQIDGPYIFQKGKSQHVIRVSNDGLSVTDIDEPSEDALFWVSSQDEKHRFEVKLHEVVRPDWKYEQPEITLVISDPHANMDAFVSILKAQKVINDNYQWAFGQNHLVIIGDVFDRGDDVLPIFWLIYKLEDEADKAGGKVHFMLGNHEEMTLRDNLKYANDKYKNIAENLNMSFSNLWSIDSELGHWLLTRNTIEQIGDNLFVHAGLSKEFLDQEWDIPQLNDTISMYVNRSKKERGESESATFLFGNDGPLWYRGMVKTDEKYNPLDEVVVDEILEQYDAKRIYVGHTIFDEVSTFYNGKVIGVNVNNQKNMDAAKSRGVLIKRDQAHKIYDNPARLPEVTAYQ